MELVDCTKKYWEFVRNLRNDERVKDGFIKSTYITEDMQQAYMTVHYKYYQIALIDNAPVGYVGVINDEIRICVHPAFQKRGVGKFMISECMKTWPSAVAKIKITNEASIKLFHSCGFSEKYLILTK
jgi:ribosomal protein S18 acetylase RimI-like enzyme